MAAVAGLAGLVAHGGVGGAIVELLLVVGFAAVFVTLWWRQRGAGRDDEDQIRPQ